MDKRLKITIFILRISLGALFLYAGIDKLLNDFSATGYLLTATKGPFQDLFILLANNSFVNFLVVWGEIGIGLSLIFGILLRFGSACGITMLMLYYFSSFPPEHGPISEHIIYSITFVILSLAGSGRCLGIDKYLETVNFIKKYKIWNYLLG